MFAIKMRIEQKQRRQSTNLRAKSAYRYVIPNLHVLYMLYMLWSSYIIFK